MSRNWLRRVDKSSHLDVRGSCIKRTPDPTDYRPLLELLEQRRLLTAVTGVDPLPSTHDALGTTDISATFDTDISPATVFPDSFAVHGMQTGKLLETLSVSGNSISLSPTTMFHPGELVQATATSGIEDLGGEPVIDPFVWEFRTAVGEGNGLGTGLFADSGQSFGDSESYFVALGDVDGDGDLDAFVGNAGYPGEPNEVWLNDSSGTFTDSGQSLGASSSYAVALGDLDGDGDLDAFVGNAGYPGEPNEVWLNDGSGTFTDSGQSLGNSDSHAVALGDVDGDGDLDAFVGNAAYPGQPNKVWLNDGGGTFTDSGQSLGNSNTRAVALGDVDGDGDLDAFVGNAAYPGQPNKVWMNDGGVFSDSGQSLGNSNSQAVALGDADGDGDLDAFVGNGTYPGQPNKVWMNDGSGAFTDSGQSLGNSNTRALALGDSDGDGDLDAFLGNGASDKVWLNDGSGTFTDSGQSLGNSFSRAVALGDVDGDGDLDAFVGNAEYPGQPIKVWLNADIPADLSVAMNDGQYLVNPGQSVIYTITVTNQGPEGVTDAIITDIFPPEIIDVSWTCFASAGASCTASGIGDIHDTISLPAGGTAVYTATGQLDSTASGSITNVATVVAPMGLDDIGPINNSARDTNVVPELDVTPQPGTHTAPVATEVAVVYDESIDPTTVSTDTFAVHATQTGQVLETLSVNGDMLTLSPTAPFQPGELVQVTATEGIANLGGEPLADPFVWQFRTATTGGTGLFTDTGQSLGNEGAAVVALGDLDGDGDLDAFVANYPHFELFSPNRVWLNDGDGNFHDNGQVLNSSRDVVLGDIDGDGDLDAITAPYLFINDGSGNFEISEQVGDYYGSALSVGDLDGDGDLDVFLTNRRMPDEVWLNDGAGQFHNSGQRLGDPEDRRAVALGDLDGDGDLDAVVSDYFETSAWMNDGDGNFGISGSPIGAGSGAIALGDLDADGDLDVILAHFGQGRGSSNHLWLNDGSGTFANSSKSLGQAGTSIALGDVEGDGDLDVFVAGELGFELQPNQLWLNDGSGNFHDSGQDLDNNFGQSVALGDLDGDGDLDAYFANRTPDRVWKNVEVDADLSISNNNGQLFATPGEPVTYTIVASNAGPDDVTDARVNDIFPEQISNISWTCDATDGSSCSSNGLGDIDDTVSLMAGGRATYTVTGIVDANAEGTIRNVATVAAPMRLQDLGPANNTAVDVDVIPPLEFHPRANSHNATSDMVIYAEYDEEVDPATVTTESFVVHAMQTGHLAEPDSNVSIEGDRVSLTSNLPLHAGELVEVSATETIKHADGKNTPKYVWRFRTGVGPEFATGRGTGVFGDSGQALGDSNSRDAVLGDIDGDGDLDALVVNGYYGHPNKIWLNEGGEFHDGGGSIGNSGERSSAALGDLDGDGDLDAFLGNGTSHPWGNEVWLNDGVGRFQDTAQYLGDAISVEVELGDVDGDGDLDAFVANRSAPNEVWLNDGIGNFHDSGQSIGNFSTAVALGDVDADGDLDALLSTNELWLNDGAGNFRDSGQRVGREARYSVVFGDVDGDGDLDAFPNPNELWLNNGQGVFQDSQQSFAEGYRNALALGDVDGDGDLDLLSADYPVNSLWLNDGIGNFQAVDQLVGNTYGSIVNLGDLDGDGDLDAFLGNHGPNEVWLNQDRPPPTGDFDLDGNVDAADLGAWQLGFGIDTDADLSDGDGDGDGDVDGRDFLIWQTQVGLGTAIGTASAAQMAVSSNTNAMELRGASSQVVEKTFAIADAPLDRLTIPLPNYIGVGGRYVFSWSIGYDMHVNAVRDHTVAPDNFHVEIEELLSGNTTHHTSVAIGEFGAPLTMNSNRFLTSDVPTLARPIADEVFATLEGSSDRRILPLLQDELLNALTISK